MILFDVILINSVKLIGLSVDTVEHHNEWLKDVNEVNSTKVEYPLLADTNRVVSKLYGMLDVNAPSAAAGMPLTVRSFFIIDANKKVRFIATCKFKNKRILFVLFCFVLSLCSFLDPASCGRNFYEFLRVIDSLKLTDVKKVATPQNWKPKEDAIVVPSISDEEATKLFGGLVLLLSSFQS